MAKKRPKRGYQYILSRIHSEIELPEISRLINIKNRCSTALTLLERRAIYSSIIVLLCARLEAYIEDVFKFTLAGLRHQQIELITERESEAAIGKFGNPNTKRINELFSTIGLANVVSHINMGNLNNNRLYSSINTLVSLRNKIAHGEESSTYTKYSINLSTCQFYYNLVKRFMHSFERDIYKYMEQKHKIKVWKE